MAVRVVKGDEWISREKLHLPTIIKIDVEGYEFEVLQGLRETIKKSRPIIFLELHLAHFKNSGPDRERVLDFLKNLDYKTTNFPLKGREEEHYICESLCAASADSILKIRS